MKTRNFAIAAHIALLAGLTATCFGAAAAGKDADDQTPVTKSQPNRSSPYSGGALMPPSPRDIARGGGIAGYGWGAGNDYGERQANGNITYAEVTHHSDGSRTVNNSTYDVHGNLRSAHQRSFDSEGNVTHIWHGDVVYPEDGGDPTMRTSWTNLKDGQVETLDRAHEPVGDPPLRDPDVDIAGTPVDDPYASGGGDGYCPPYLPGCQREGKPRQSPNRVNPGDPDQVDTPQAPRLVVESESLVTNPDPTGSPGSGFSPPAGWQEDIEGGGKTPGAMPPRDGRGAP